MCDDETFSSLSTLPPSSFFPRHIVPIPCLPQPNFFSSQDIIVVILIVLEVQFSFRTFSDFFYCILFYYNSGFMVNHFSKSLSQEPGVFVIICIILSLNIFPNLQKLANVSLKYEYTINQTFFWYKSGFRKWFWTSFFIYTWAGFHIQSGFSHMSLSNCSFLFQQYGCLFKIWTMTTAIVTTWKREISYGTIPRKKATGN